MAEIELAPYTDADREAAIERGRLTRESSHAVTHARYHRRTRELEVQFRNGFRLNVPVAAIAGLRGRADRDLADVHISPLRDGLIWPKIDVAIYAPGLIKEFGPKDKSDNLTPLVTGGSEFQGQPWYTLTVGGIDV